MGCETAGPIIKFGRMMGFSITQLNIARCVYEGGSARVSRGVCSSERGVSSGGSAGGRLGAKVFTRNKVPRVMDIKARWIGGWREAINSGGVMVISLPALSC